MLERVWGQGLDDKLIQVHMANALICTWLELEKALEPLHLNDKADVDELHDIWLSQGVPAPSYRVALPGERFDERNPRPGDNLKHVVNPLAVAKWIQDVSAKRGFPYNERQAINMTQGVMDDGR